MASSLESRREIPSRLRLTRQNYSFAATVADNTHTISEHDSESDNGSDTNTPRYGPSRLSIDSLDGPPNFSAQAQAQSTPAPVSNPARLLRDLIARVNGTETPTPRANTQRPRTPSGSLLESDMDSDDQDTPMPVRRSQLATPRPNNNSPPSPALSEARKKVHNIFSRALREPGETPERRPRFVRRGSMDSSIAEENPVKAISRVSVSEDERETLYRSGASEATTKKSPENPRTAVDDLRERIEMSNFAKSSVSSMSSTSSVDKENVVPNYGKRLYSISNTAGPSQRSLSQFPSQFLGSNLMNDNTEMRRMLMNSQAESTDSEAPQKQGHNDETPKASFTGSSQLKELMKMNDNLRWRRGRRTNGSDGLQSKGRELAENDNNQKDRLEPQENAALSSYRSRPKSKTSGFSDLDEDPIHDSTQDLTIRDQRHQTASQNNGLNGSMSSEDTQRPEVLTQARISTRQRGRDFRSEPTIGRREDGASDSETPFASLSHAPPRGEHTIDTERAQERQSNWIGARLKSIREVSPQLSAERNLVPYTKELSRVSHNGAEQWVSDNKFSVQPENGLKQNESSSRIPNDVGLYSSENAPYQRSRVGSTSASVQNWHATGTNGQVSQAPSHQNMFRGDPRTRQIQRVPSVSSESASSVDLENEKTPRGRGKLPSEVAAIPFQSTMADQQRDVSRIKVRQRASSGSKTNPSPEGEESGTPVQRSYAKPNRASIASEALKLHDSDIESFQEEDIAASSSAPRVYNIELQSNLDEESSQLDLTKATLTSQRHKKYQIKEGDTPANLPANFSPPPSPPNYSTADSVITTPKRHAGINSSKLGFKTPSPPKGMPALPDPPSSDEPVDSNRVQPSSSRLPSTPATRNKYEDMKTPRPPGAWATPFATPAPRAQLERGDLDPKNNLLLQNDIYTPPASYSRATSMIMKTPAPPGAWLPTPAPTTLKRLQQKVRFDDGDTPMPAGQQHVFDDSSLTSNDPLADGSVAMKAAGKKRLPSPRMGGRLRILDAFGNLIKPTEPERKSSVTVMKQTSETKMGPNDSPKRTTKLRILDSTGKEINEPKEAPMVTSTRDEATSPSKHSEDEEDVTALIEEIKIKHLERNRALELLKENISWLKDAFIKNDDRSQKSGDFESQLSTLREQSIRARDNQEQLLKRIKELEDIDQQLGLLSTGNISGRLRHGDGTGSRWTLLRSLFFLIFLQTILLVLFYRLFSLGARQLYLTTYIDPFYPELNLHVMDPDFLHCSVTNSCVPRFLYRLKWIEPVISFMRVFVDSFSIVRDTVWGPSQSAMWPPT